MVGVALQLLGSSEDYIVNYLSITLTQLATADYIFNLFPFVSFLQSNTQEYQTMGTVRFIPSLWNLQGFLSISGSVQAWLRA